MRDNQLVSVWGHLTVGSLTPQTCSVVISPVTEGIIATELLSSWQNSHITFLTCGVRVIIVGKIKLKPLEVSLPRGKNDKLKAILHF